MDNNILKIYNNKPFDKHKINKINKKIHKVKRMKLKCQEIKNY
jgi:hypothetical protein